MKARKQSVFQPVSILVLTLTLMPGGAAAQSASPIGSYGFLINASTNDTNPAESSGTAVLGVMNFDGLGNLTGTYTLDTGGSGGGEAQTSTGTLTGTYSGNPDGTGALTLNLDFGASLTFATAISNGGQVLQLISTAGSGQASNLGGGDTPLLGSATQVTGVMPAALFINGATGNLNLSLPGTTSAGGAMTVYTAAGGTFNGPVACDDGSTQTWSATVSAITVAIFPSGPGSYLGDYLFAVAYTECGNGNESQTFSGSVSGNAGAGGGVNLILHGSGAVVSGTARAGQATSLQGSYSYRTSGSPTPTRSIGVLTFDGAGNATLSGTSVGAPGAGLQLPVSTVAFTGTYSINSNGSGTLTFTAANGSAGPAFAFAITDGGSQILLLRTDGAPGANAVTGTARLQ